MNIPLSSINEGTRIRKDYKNLDTLCDSLTEFGQLQPILIDSSNTLIAGGRRFRAASMLGWETIDVKQIGEVTEADLRMMELEENTEREPMTWQENCLSIYAIYHARLRASIINKDRERYTFRQAGAAFGMSYGYVALLVRLAEYIQKEDVEIIACSGPADAMKVIAGRAEETAKARALEMQKAQVQARAVPALPTPGRVQSFQPTDEEDKNEDALSDVDAPWDEDTDDLADLTLTGLPTKAQMDDLLNLTSPHCILGDSVYVVMPAMPEASVDHIITDIPYGIDMDNLDTFKNIDETAEQHDVAENVSLMPDFMKAAFRVLKDKGFCIFFYDLAHHEKLLSWAKAAGFKPQDWPLIWHKTTPCRNSAAQVNWTKNYEAIMVLRKGTGHTLNKVQSSSVLVGGLSSLERATYIHPFTKPFNIVERLVSAIAHPGQTILDPFAGEFSIVCHLLALHMNPIGIELMPHHYSRGLAHVQRTLTSPAPAGPDTSSFV